MPNLSPYFIIMETKQTEEREVWKQIFDSKTVIQRYNGNTYIGYLGMYLKLSRGMMFKMNRETGKWIAVDNLTFRPLKLKGEGNVDRNKGYEKYGT